MVYQNVSYSQVVDSLQRDIHLRSVYYLKPVYLREIDKVRLP